MTEGNLIDVNYGVYDAFSEHAEKWSIGWGPQLMEIGYGRVVSQSSLVFSFRKLIDGAVPLSGAPGQHGYRLLEWFSLGYFPHGWDIGSGHGP